MNLLKGLKSFWVGFRKSRRLRLAKASGQNEEDLLAEEDLYEEIEKEKPTKAQRIEHCKSELKSDYYPDAVIFAAFGEEIFSAALAEL